MTAAPLTEPSQETTPPPDPRLWNEDLAPAQDRRWKVYDIFALWMSDVHNLGNYTFAAGLFVLGLSAWQVFTALLFGFVLIYVGMNLMGRIGQRTGVPFPVVARHQLRHVRRQPARADPRGHRDLLVRHPDLPGQRGHHPAAARASTRG